MTIDVQVVPIRTDEVPAIWSLLERYSWEVRDGELALLSDRGLVQRRLWVIEQPRAAWVVDAMEARECDTDVVRSVWSAAMSGLDLWLHERGELTFAADAASLPHADPALVLNVSESTAAAATRSESADDRELQPV